MGRNTDVDVEETNAIQEHDADTQQDVGEEHEQSQHTVDEDLKAPPKFVTDRDRRAAEMLERQREQRNEDIARELGLEKHPEFVRKEDGEDVEDSEPEQVEITDETDVDTISDETKPEPEPTEPEATEIDEENKDDSPQNVDKSETSDLELSKPGFYGSDVVLKVDGQLVKMPADKALSILQKSQAADKRLENVVLRERQLQAREEQLRQQQQYRPQPSEPKKPDVVQDADIEKRARTIVQSVEDGEQEKAVESLVALVKDTVGRREPQVQQPTLTADQITSLVAQQSKAFQADSVEAHLKAGGQYDDIFNDGTAYGLAVENVRRLTASGFQGSTEQLMVEAMESVRDWRSGMSRELRLEAQKRASKSEPESKPKPKPEPKISEPQRLEKKRKSPKPVGSTTTITRPAAVQPEQELSEVEKRRAIFDEVKAARNQ